MNKKTPFGIQITRLFIILAFCSIYSKTNAQNIWNTYRSPSEILNTYEKGIKDKNRTSTDRVAIEFSILGKMDSTLKYANFFFSEEEKYITPAYAHKENLEAVPALQFIFDQIKDHQVVIVNEIHHLPSHRVFTADLLKELYQKGFRYIGFEGLLDAEINQRKFPTTNSGYYVKEPQFGNLVRYAILLGYTVFGYENSDREKNRELGQAENIYKIIQADSSARVVIHSGGGHLREDTLSRYYMGGYFKKISGIDPLTINNGKLTEQSAPQFEGKLYNSLAPADFPVVYIDKNTKTNVNDSVTDIQVFHPRTKTVKGRPSWIKDNKRYSKITVTTKFKFKEPYMIFAYMKNEFDSGEPAVPVDILFVDDPKQTKNLLAVPFKGKYTLVFQSKTETKFGQTEVK